MLTQPREFRTTQPLYRNTGTRCSARAHESTIMTFRVNVFCPSDGDLLGKGTRDDVVVGVRSSEALTAFSVNRNDEATFLTRQHKTPHAPQLAKQFHYPTLCECSVMQIYLRGCIYIFFSKSHENCRLSYPFPANSKYTKRQKNCNTNNIIS